MSASVTFDSFGSEEPKSTGTRAVSDPIVVVDDLTVVEELVGDDITIIDDDIEIIEDPVPTPAASASPVADEPPSGIHDPIMPLVVLGVITLIAMLALAATLAL